MDVIAAAVRHCVRLRSGVRSGRCVQSRLGFRLFGHLDVWCSSCTVFRLVRDPCFMCNGGSVVVVCRVLCLLRRCFVLCPSGFAERLLTIRIAVCSPVSRRMDVHGGTRLAAFFSFGSSACAWDVHLSPPGCVMLVAVTGDGFLHRRCLTTWSTVLLCCIS